MPKSETKRFIDLFREREGPFSGQQLSEEEDFDLVAKRINESLAITRVTMELRELKNEAFKNCTFTGCQFSHVIFNYCEFDYCKFVDCTFHNCVLDDCGFTETVFNGFYFGGELSRVTFAQTTFAAGGFRDTHFIQSIFGDTVFIKCGLYDTSFTPSGYMLECKFQFEFQGSKLVNSTFIDINLSESFFKSCKIELCTFSRVTLSSQTFDPLCVAFENNYNSIDLFSIHQSKDVSSSVYKHLFGIHSSDVKNYISEMVSTLEFQSVFISYSFIDRLIATRINNELRGRGVFTFLWEQDAPGGKRMKKIMSEKINKYDRILFVASKHSLKSDACHFELMEGRAKYAKNWEDVLFPIHIDNYLFEIRDYDIPREKRELFWSNILELREIHSRDFSILPGSTTRINAFEKLIDNLVSDLRKTKI